MSSSGQTTSAAHRGKVTINRNDGGRVDMLILLTQKETSGIRGSNLSEGMTAVKPGMLFPWRWGQMWPQEYNDDS
jgi:hypothetical protein